MKFCFQKIIFICPIIVLGGILFFPNIVLFAETGDLFLLKNETKGHLVFSERNTKELFYAVVGATGEELKNFKVSAVVAEEKMSAPLIIRQGPQIKTLGFWHKFFWKPAENQIRGATVILKKFLPKTDKIIDGIESASSKILQAGQTIKSAAANLGGKINNYFQNIKTSANIVDLSLVNPGQVNQSDNGQAPTLTQKKSRSGLDSFHVPNEDTSQTEIAPTDRLSIIQIQLNALIERIDDIAEQTDELIASQSQIIPQELPSGESKTLEQSTASIKTPSEPQPNSSEQTTSINPSIPIEKTFPTESTQTQTQDTTLANQITDNQTTIVPPPPPAQILISEVKTESQESLSDEYIELYNPNNSAVDLGGFILRKKTSGGSESALVSSAKFKGVIPAFGYFLITPQVPSTDSASSPQASSEQTIIGDLQYSGLSYYIAQTNSIFLYDKYERLLDKAENVVHPRSHSFGRKSSSATSDFEAQLSTPGAENRKDIIAPQITILTKPESATSTTTAAFSFSANEPGCSFEYQLDGEPWQQSDDDPVAVNFKNLNTGQHSFQIRAMDPVGNWANLAQYFWEITAAPAQPPVPEPKILISEIQIESATSAKDEFIELYNPNDFTVDLANFSLKKKTSSGAESNLLSSSYFTGVIAERGYFLIAPQDKSADLNYSGKDYSAAKDNTVLLYSKNGSLIDKLGFGQAADFETSPAQNPNKGYSLGRKWLETENSEQDTDNNQNDFETQIPTPGAKNEKDTAPPVSRLEGLATSSTSTNLIIEWSGTDNLSGILNYDIQYKEGSDGEWRDFIQATTSLQANFIGEDEETYYFRSKARDIAGNESAWPEEAETFCKIEIPKDNESAEPVLEVLVASSTTSTALFFSAIRGAQNPSSQSLLIKNSGQAEMAWDIFVDSPQSWLSLSLTSGTLLAETSINIEIAIDIFELEPGNYQATATIAALGAKNSPQEVQINLLIEEPINQTPSALFSYSPNENLRVGDEIIFDGSSSADPDGEITAFIWDFGDGFSTTTYSEIITHSFTASGEFLVSLVVQDNKDEKSSTTTANIKIAEEPKIIISEIQIFGKNGESFHDFIELYNPFSNTADISGFQLKKKSSSGNEYSIRLFPEGSIIPAQGYFLWQNSDYEAAVPLSANTTSTQTLAKNNSIALLNKNKKIIDAVAWGTSSEAFVENSSFSQNPADNQSLGRKWNIAENNYQDTDNNEDDFEIQIPTPKAK